MSGAHITALSGWHCGEKSKVRDPTLEVEEFPCRIKICMIGIIMCTTYHGAYTFTLNIVRSDGRVTHVPSPRM